MKQLAWTLLTWKKNSYYGKAVWTDTTVTDCLSLLRSSVPIYEFGTLTRTSVMFLGIYTEGCVCVSGRLVVKVAFVVGGLLFCQVTRASGWYTPSQYKYSPGTTDGTQPKTLTWPLKHLSSWSSWMLCNGTAERTEAHGPHDPKNPPPVSCCPLPGDTRTHRSRVHSWQCQSCFDMAFNHMHTNSVE